MQVYLTAVFNHFRALQAWSSERGAKLTLDVRTFDVEVKHRGRYYLLRPMFQARTDGQLIHTNVLTPDMIGFGGWRPYDTIRHSHSNDKLLFKSFLLEAGLRTPASVGRLDVEGLPTFDYLLKAASGSFGRQIAGPFRAGMDARSRTPMPSANAGATFAEQFIEGSILKVWFWGRNAFFAHAHEFPVVVGDGVNTAEQLLLAKLLRSGNDWSEFVDKGLVADCLYFQDVAMDAVLEAGDSAWIDYRYSHRYEPSRGVTRHTDNALAALLQTSGEQVARMGAALGSLLAPAFPAPLLITVDGMLDKNGDIWWLEMNTNSVVPPEGYAAMFNDLFA